MAERASEKRDISERADLEIMEEKGKKSRFGAKKKDGPGKEKRRKKKLDDAGFIEAVDKSGGTGKKDKEPKEKKKAGAFTGFFCGLLIMILLFAVAFAALYFDIYGSKVLLSEFLGLSKTNEEVRQTQEAGFEQQRADIARLHAELEVKSAELDSRDGQLSVRESEIEEKAGELEKKNGEVEGLRIQLKNQAIDLEETVKLLSGMDISNASSIISEMADRDYVVRVLRAMKPKMASEILATLDPKEASGLLAQMAADGGA